MSTSKKLWESGKVSRHSSQILCELLFFCHVSNHAACLCLSFPFFFWHWKSCQTFEQSTNIRVHCGWVCQQVTLGLVWKKNYFCILLLLQVFVPFPRFFTISIFLEPLFVLALHHFQSSDAPLCFLRHGSQHLTLSCQQPTTITKTFAPSTITIALALLLFSPDLWDLWPNYLFCKQLVTLKRNIS